MKYNLFIFCMINCLLACTSLPKTETQGCMTEKQASNVLEYLEKAADLNADSNNVPKTKTSLIQTSCNKRVYEKNGYRLLLYQNPVVGDGTVLGSLSSKEKLGSKECLSEGVSEVEALSPLFTKIIELHRTKWSWLWDDYDIGPAKWLNCNDRKSIKWSDSLSTFIHELNHEIRENNCIRYAKDASQLCIDLAPQLPLRSLAKLESFPTKDPNQQAGMAFFQRTYLTDLDQPPLLLFEELNSYILTTRAYTKILEKNGESALFEQEHRPAVILPLFLYYSTLYIERLKNSNPNMYNENFVKKSENLRAIKSLLDEGESAYKSWLLILKKIHKPQKEVEKNIWNIYLQNRSNMKL